MNHRDFYEIFFKVVFGMCGTVLILIMLMAHNGLVLTQHAQDFVTSLMRLSSILFVGIFLLDTILLLKKFQDKGLV